MTRVVHKVLTSVPVTEGAGVRLRRAFGFHQAPQLDPFLLLDDFRSRRAGDYVRGFPWHPHRGIETVTYMLAGSVEHGDSLGNSGAIGPGDVQWMTAGSGIIHQEMPKGDAHEAMGGFQLWVNLPAKHKMMAPRYREVKAADIGRLELSGGASAAVIAGEIGAVRGPVRDLVVPAAYLDVRVPARAAVELPVQAGDTVFAYVIEGRGYFDRRRDPYSWRSEKNRYFDLENQALLGEHSLIVFGAGERVEVEAGDEGVRFLLAAGTPLGEPVAWFGPIVMNTRDELRAAFEEYERGDFLKHQPQGRPPS